MVVDCGVKGGVEIVDVAYWEVESRPQILPSLPFFVSLVSGGVWRCSGSIVSFTSILDLAS